MFFQKERFMENLFEEIIQKCNHKKVVSLCKKLAKKLSFNNMKDVENLCHLVYWLYILNEKELAKKCIILTDNLQFNQNYNVWSFIHSIWGLNIKLLCDEGKDNEADDIIKTISQHYLMPIKSINETPEKTQIRENKRRERVTLEKASNKEEIENCLKDKNIKLANEYRFVAIIELISNIEIGIYPNLNKDKEVIEVIIKKYIEEILK